MSCPKYKEVRTVGYRDPVTNGYPKFKEVVAKKAVLQGGGKLSPGVQLTKDRLAEIDKGFRVADQEVRQVSCAGD